MLRFPVRFALLLLACLAATVLWQQAQLAVLALARIDPVPEVRQLIAEERYAEAGEFLDFFLAYDYVRDDPAAQALEADIEAVRGSVGYRLDKMGEGLIAGTSDEPIGQVAGVITDFFVIGDLRDLAIQSNHWVQGKEVDEVIIALATIGLAASTAQLVTAVATVGTAGAASPGVAASTITKGSLSLLKAARKLGTLPPWLGRTLIRQARVVKATGKLDDIAGLLGDVDRVAATPGGMRLLGQTEDAVSLSRMVRAVDRFGDATSSLYRIGGDSFVQLANRSADFGVESIKLAATYGVTGLRVLETTGATRFIKYSARGSKMLHKGEVLDLILRFLAGLPTWLLSLLIGLGVLVWMPKSKEPVTAAVRCLREWAVPFTGFLYPYSGGGTAEVARALGVDEHQVVKTLIMQDAEARPLIVLMHGDREVATGKLARQLGTKSVRPCEPKVADKHSGYQVGGTSPFATRSRMPVCCERGILDFDQIYINGGKRGYIIRLATSDLQRILEPMLFEMAT